MGQSKPAKEKRGGRNAVLRRPPEPGLPRFRHQLRQSWRRLIEVRALWIVLFVLVSTWCLLPPRASLLRPVEPGSIAARTFIADRDLSVPNEAATRELQEQAREDVPPVYDFDRSVEADLRRQLAALFEAGREELAEPLGELPPGDPPPGGPKVVAPETSSAELDRSADLLARLAEASTFRITAHEAELLRQRGFESEIEDRLDGIVSRLLRQGVVSDKELLLEHQARGITVQELPSGERETRLDLYRYLDYPEELEQAVEEVLLSWDGLSSRERPAFAELILANVAPNLTLNSSATLDLRERAAADAGAVSRTIREGEVIVRQGGRVDEVAAKAIAAMAGSRNLRQLVLTVLGFVLLLAAATLLVWLASEERRDRSRERSLSECLILLMLHLMGARFAYLVAGALGDAIQRQPFGSALSYSYAVPLASLALLAVLLYGRDKALVLSLVFSLLVGHLVGGDAVWTTMIYALASSLAAVYTLDHHRFKQRSAMTRAGVVVGGVNVAALLTLKAMGGEVSGGLPQLGFDLVCGFAGGLLAAAVASFSVPIFEGLFSIATSIKLLELANPNLPMLRRLAFEAPGTFQHSLAVANLAKSGCEAIGGDSVLVNTGALYHDIGKIYRPRYFVENQVPNQNPHDNIQPSMSALILINHVKEGLELAHRQGLPQPIIEAISEHHGTRLIKFFFSRAKESRDPGAEQLREEDFRYPGPKPQSKETGVLMLADAVEAASRTLVDPSRQKLRTVIRRLFEDCLRDGQLDETDLTLGDLRRVEEAFLRVLTNVYHRRVDYPGFDFNRRQRAPEIGKRPISEETSDERRKAS